MEQPEKQEIPEQKDEPKPADPEHVEPPRKNQNQKKKKKRRRRRQEKFKKSSQFLQNFHLSLP